MNTLRILKENWNLFSEIFDLKFPEHFNDWSSQIYVQFWEWRILPDPDKKRRDWNLCSFSLFINLKLQNIELNPLVWKMELNTENQNIWNMKIWSSSRRKLISKPKIKLEIRLCLYRIRIWSTHTDCICIEYRYYNLPKNYLHVG